MSKQTATLSVIIPSFNEEATIVQVLDKVFGVKLVNGIRKEIIIINDASTDQTDSLVREYIDIHPSYPIMYLNHPINQGKGKAIRTALEQVSGDFVIIQDADLEYDPEDYNKLLTVLTEEKRKVVYGSRFLGKKDTYSHFLFYLGGKIVTWSANLLYNQRLTDEPTCYKLFDASLLKSISLQCKGFEFCPEVTAKVAKAGHRIKEIPITYYSRSKEEGKKIKWTDGLKAIWTLLKYRFIN
ncbi:MAG: glycosyltransferase family 2 protein [Tannerellaceae bacterium]|nr:glycosyltransferase family 2 protein [Tannerellaceae bacterium]